MNKKGFTLIELLVVISIIGILAAMIAVSFTSSQRQARDTARKSDLSQYRSALESVANNSNGIYPIHSGGTDASVTLCADLPISGGCPEDPKHKVDNTYPQYEYQSDAGGTSYVLWASLENSSNVWVACSSGQSGAVGSFSGGACPL